MRDRWGPERPKKKERSSMPNQPRPDNPPRTVRVEDTLWIKARARAAITGETISDVVRRALAAYIR
jgi:hypothetical protein